MSSRILCCSHGPDEGNDLLERGLEVCWIVRVPGMSSVCEWVFAFTNVSRGNWVRVLCRAPAETLCVECRMHAFHLMRFVLTR